MSKFIKLSKGYETEVDDEWFDYLNQWKWYYRDGYAVRHSEVDHNKEIKMHRVIMGDSEGSNSLFVDHINLEKVTKDKRGLNNKTSNLRWATRSQNNTNRVNKNNTSGYKGVHWNKRDKRFVARVAYKGKYIIAGNFDDPQSAAIAYNMKAIEVYGEFAVLNEVF